MRIALETFTGSAWMAGIVLFRDLVVALHQLGDERPILEMVEWWNTNEEDYAPYKPFVDGSLRPIFPQPPPDRKPNPVPLQVQPLKSLGVRIRRLLARKLTSPPLPPPPSRPDEMMRHLGVDCVFSVTLEHRSDVSTALLVWIYDLQHHHFPELLGQAELERRNRIIAREAECATRLIVTSESVRDDLAAFLPQHKDKIRVIHFVSDIPDSVYDSVPGAVLARYDLPSKFIYLPNQFWQHKNHLRVILALERLRESGVLPVVVCTGSTVDHRNPDFIIRVEQEIQRAQLEKHFVILGSIPRPDVFALIRQSVCVMNPSLFEGLGLSAAEATSLGKRTLLADLPSLREQNPPDAMYFDPTDTDEMAERIKQLWSSAEPGPDLPREAAARAALAGRQREFAREFLEIANEAVLAFRARS